jgi:hypothetical protein
MQYPDLLQTESAEAVHLPSAGVVEVPKATPAFEKWTGEPIEDTYGGKIVLSFAGEPVFAELAILRTFQNSGWSGVWVDSFRKKYRVGYWRDDSEVALPPEQELLLQRIHHRAGASGGCWDVFCWRGDARLFAEAKRRGHDEIRDTQRRWLEAAIGIGLAIDSFLVVEWSAR